MKLPAPCSFDWDKGNVDKSWKKHKVCFKEAEEVFFNKPLKVFPDKEHSEREKRFVAFGVTNLKRRLRNQSKKERGEYEKK